MWKGSGQHNLLVIWALFGNSGSSLRLWFLSHLVAKPNSASAPTAEANRSHQSRSLDTHTQRISVNQGKWQFVIIRRAATCQTGLRLRSWRTGCWLEGQWPPADGQSGQPAALISLPAVAESDKDRDSEPLALGVVFARNEGGDFHLSWEDWCGEAYLLRNGGCFGSSPFKARRTTAHMGLHWWTLPNC